MERRTFLSTGSASVLALAAGNAAATPVRASGGPVDVVSAYYRRAADAESDRAFTAQVPELAHSASPLPALADASPNAFDGALRQSLVDAEVVATDVSAETIRSISDFLAGWLSDEAIETIAETNAVVAVSLESEAVIGGELAKEWLVAPEGGEWRLVWFDERDAPGAAARRFFRSVALADSFEALDDPVDAQSHSASPLLNVAEYTPWYFRGIRRQSLRETEVVARNVDATEIAAEFGSFLSWASQDELAEIAGENAVVAMALRDADRGVEAFDQQWLLAPEYGDWRVVWF
jgi:hypothetical protein